MTEPPESLRAMAAKIDALLKVSSVWSLARRAEDLLISARAELRLRAIELEEHALTTAEAASEGKDQADVDHA